MAHYNIIQNKKGNFIAKIQAYGKNNATGEKKLFVKRIYNESNLSEAKFKKFVQKAAIKFEEKLKTAYNNDREVSRTRILSFAELMTEWKESIRTNLSISYYERAQEIEKKFNKYLDEQHIANLPISEITVRDIQRFFDSFAKNQYTRTRTALLIKTLPECVNFRELAREKVVSRNTSYYMKKGMNRITIEKAEKICTVYKLNINEYFDISGTKHQYSLETIKGYRRILRAIFNEAVRYEWIKQNPVCKTKITAGNTNLSLRPVPEKEVFSLKEAQLLLKALSNLDESSNRSAILIKMMLLTGMRNGEVHGLKWSDINFDHHIIHVHRNRLYSKDFGIYEKDPKTRTSTRDIPLPDSLIVDLKKFQNYFRVADKDFDRKLNQYYVAVNELREPACTTTLGNWLDRFERRHGFKHVSCHGLRHTYCSILLSQNVPIQTVSRYLGHSDSTITLKVYSHFIPDTQSKALNVLNIMAKEEND